MNELSLVKEGKKESKIHGERKMMKNDDSSFVGEKKYNLNIFVVKEEKMVKMLECDE